MIRPRQAYSPASRAALGGHWPLSALRPICLSVGKLSVRVLTVDDQQDATSALAVLLKLTRCEVRVTYDAKTALSLAREILPSLLLVDVGLAIVAGHDWPGAFATALSSAHQSWRTSMSRSPFFAVPILCCRC
jgi:hypothetical protein